MPYTHTMCRAYTVFCSKARIPMSEILKKSTPFERLAVVVLIV